MKINLFTLYYETPAKKQVKWLIFLPKEIQIWWLHMKQSNHFHCLDHWENVLFVEIHRMERL